MTGPGLSTSNLDAERAVLGAVLLGGRDILDGIDVDPADFYVESHGVVLSAMRGLHQKGGEIDVITVCEELRRRGQLDRAGGRAAVDVLAASVPHLGDMRQHAGIVSRLARERRVRSALARALEQPEEASLRAAHNALSASLAADQAGERRTDYRMLTVRDLAKLPPPSYLVQDFLTAGGFNVLFGASGTGKSFLALDWALCIASGLKWYGQDVQQGSVVYIAAEGVSGLYPRVDAWMDARGVDDVPGFRVIAEATNLLVEADVARVETSLRQLPDPPVMVVWDTLARNMTGGDENAARDVGLAIAAADRVAAPYAAARFVIHHTGRNGELERGSTALRGACDTMTALREKESGLQLVCEKAKDAEEFQPWKLHLRPTLGSCVIGAGTLPGTLGPNAEKILASVPGAFGTLWASSTQLQEAAGASKTSTHEALKSLVDGGFLEKDSSGRYPQYRITDAGLNRSVPERSGAFDGTHGQRSVPPPSLRGGTRNAADPEPATSEQQALIDSVHLKEQQA